MRVGRSSSAPCSHNWRLRCNLNEWLFNMNVNMNASVRLPTCSADHLYLLADVLDTIPSALDIHLEQEASVEPW